MALFPTTDTVREIQRRNGVMTAASRIVPEEVPVAFSYGGSTHAVMMATPADLEDFAVGFSLSEGIISTIDDIVAIEALRAGDGIDLQITLADPRAEALTARRRHMTGPVGCGLCGIESIEQATRSVPDVGGTALTLATGRLVKAVRLLGGGQILNRETHAVHGAGFYVEGHGLIAIREDVGRHNALDKLIGAVLRAGHVGASGAVVVTSRLSVEMVQKAAMLGSSILVAISAPTALAIRTAEAANMTLVAVARGEDFEIFTRPERITAGAMSDVA